MLGLEMTKKTLGEGKYLRLVIEGHYEFVERVNATGVVVIVPVTDNGKIVLVEQRRLPIGRNMVELPAGLVEDGETLDGAAGRELLEETGYEPKELRKLGRWPTSSGMSSEIVSVYLATGLRKKGEGGGDATEQITVHAVDIKQADAWLDKMERAGAMLDPKIYAGLYLYQRLQQRNP
jgi:ADP-ribose pyrophosphatase